MEVTKNIKVFSITEDQFIKICLYLSKEGNEYYWIMSNFFIAILLDIIISLDH